MQTAFAKYLIMAALLAGCRPKPPDAVSAPDHYKLKFEEASKRLVEHHLVDGWVVSKQYGEAKHTGDSLIWSGVALGVLDCETARPILRNLLGVIAESGGALYRYKDVSPGDEISFDGETGFMYGWLLHAARCPLDFLSMQAAWVMRQEFIKKHGGELYPGTGATVPAVFSFTVDLGNRFFRKGPPPSEQKLAIMAKAATGWAVATKLSKKSCFRIHLGWLHIKTAESFGYYLSGADKADFCNATSDTQIPLIDAWCQREGLDTYLATFEHDVWEYRHQRCGAWEYPDGKDYETPGLDYLIGIREAYNLDAPSPGP